VKIRFIGLISHVRTTKGDHLAVLIHEKDHIPLLRYIEGDVVGGDDKNTTPACEKLANTTVTTSLTGTIIVKRGLAGVPNLTEHGGTGKKLHAELEKNKVVKDRFTTVMVLRGDALRGASYYVEDWFQHHGSFGVGKEVCLPQTVVLDIPTTSDVTLTITPEGGGGATDIKFKPVATVTITNAEELIGGGSHFNLFGKVFEDAAGGGTIFIQGPKPEGVKCGHGSDSVSAPKCPNGGGQTVGVECSNSQYP
jgi:hypothetical protein